MPWLADGYYTTEINACQAENYQICIMTETYSVAREKFGVRKVEVRSFGSQNNVISVNFADYPSSLARF